MYEIQTKFEGNWTTDGLGDGPNEFPTEAEAEAAVESLKALGPEWAGAEYRVRLI